MIELGEAGDGFPGNGGRGGETFPDRRGFVGVNDAEKGRNDGSADPEWAAGDALWDLLGRVPPVGAGPGFVDRVMREMQRERRMRRLRVWGGFAGAVAAAVVTMLVVLRRDGNEDAAPSAAVAEVQVREIEEVMGEEVLLAAAEHLDQFSDSELVDLLGL